READAAAAAVQQLKEEGVDLIVCLSHGGVNPAGFGADRDLAIQVPDIDVIVSGHTHVDLAQPLVVGKTLIVSAGAYGKYVGRLEATVRPGRAVQLDSYRLVTVDDSVAADQSAPLQEKLTELVQAVDAQVLAPLGVTYATTVVESGFDLTLPDYTEGNLGDLITDSILHATAQRLGRRPDVAVESAGAIRDTLPAGQLWVADAFRSLPLGIGLDLQGGYPLLTFFLQPQELKAGLEVLTIAEELVGSPDFFLQLAGVRVTWNPLGMWFDRVTRIELWREEQGWQEVDLAEQRLYEIAVNYYNAALLSLVEAKTGGALKLTPRDAAGEPLPSLAAAIVDDQPGEEGLQELKQWRAFIELLQSFPDLDDDQIPDLPAEYAQPQGRIVAQ
ncbi:MAG: bifunctional metallophosphatase/5'-nucleotidase, partial [Deltaproteobacteria bacterium]|nr:bifunctional metallophosphatase/5'-nucleotidase [Deltaproteobacteria bacterium]